MKLDPPNLNSSGLDVSLPAHMRRVLIEGDELAKKLDALAQFMTKPDFKALDPLDAHLLSLQREVMQSYLHILTIRLARARDAARFANARNAGNVTLGGLNTGQLDKH